MSDGNLLETTCQNTRLLAIRRNEICFAEEVLGLEVADYQREWYQIAQNKELRKILILAPRNHAKSTIFSVNHSSWEIGNDPNTTILEISNAASQAESFLRSIKTIIEREEKYIEVFGNLMPRYPEKWTNREIIVNRNTKEKDPTFSTVGTGGAILSKRANLIIADDILNKDNTRTVESRKKVMEWWKDIVMPVLDPNNGRLIWIATAFNLEDLSHELMKDPTFDIRLRYKAIIKEADDKKKWEQYTYLLLNRGKKDADAYYMKNKLQMDYGAVVLWPQRWSYKRLFDERISLGTRSFNLMYQNEAVSDETAIIREEWVEKCKDPDRSLLTNYDISNSDLGHINIAIGVDLAISEAERADWNVITVLAKTQDNKYVILNREKGHWSPKQIRENIKGMAERFPPDIILVENNAFQESLVKDLKDETTLPIKGFTTTGEKFDSYVGINSLAVILENGQMIIPANPKDPRTVDFYQELKEEMITFPSGHTGDTLMSLWFAFTGLRDITATGRVVSVKSENIRKDVIIKE